MSGRDLADRHGTHSRYVKHKCRCDLCRAARAAYMRDYRDRKAGVMTPDSVAPVPNQPKTPQRTFRIPEAVYEAAKAKAATKGETLTDVVRRALERYVKRS